MSFRPPDWIILALTPYLRLSFFLIADFLTELFESIRLPSPFPLASTGETNETSLFRKDS